MQFNKKNSKMQNNKQLPDLTKLHRNDLPSLRCPLCDIKSPIIDQLQYDKKHQTPMLSLKCSCLYSDTSDNKKENTYPITISDYFRFLFSKVHCFKHLNSKPSIYCKKCNLLLCDVCVSYHELFEKDHSDLIEQIKSVQHTTSTKQDINNNMKQHYDNQTLINLWNKTNSMSHIKSYEQFEKEANDVYIEYQTYIEDEIKIITEMIANLNQLKNDIEIKHKETIDNFNKVTTLAKIVYNDFFYNKDNNTSYENIINMNSLLPIVSLIKEKDILCLNKICQNFNQIIALLYKQQQDFPKRTLISFETHESKLTLTNNNTNTQSHPHVSTTVSISKHPQSPEHNQSESDNDDISSDNEQNITNTNNNNRNIIKETNDIPASNLKGIKQESIVPKHYIEISPTISPLSSNKRTPNTKGITNNNMHINIFSNTNHIINNIQTPLNIFRHDLSSYYSYEQSNIIQEFSHKSNNSPKFKFPSKCSSVLSYEYSAPSPIIQLKQGNILFIENNNNIVIWDMKSNYPLTKMNLGEFTFNYIYELNNGQIALCSNDNVIKIYKPNNFLCTSMLIGHSEKINSLLQINNSILISASKDSSIKFWNLNTNECFHTIYDHIQQVNMLIHLQKKIFASCSDDSTIKIWNKTKLMLQLIGHKGKVVTMGKLGSEILCSGGEEFNIKIWNVLTGECLGSLIGHEGRIKQIVNFEISFEEFNVSYLVSVGTDKRIVFWDVMQRRKIWEVEDAHNDSIESIVTFKEGIMITGGREGNIKLWN